MSNPSLRRFLVLLIVGVIGLSRWMANGAPSILYDDDDSQTADDRVLLPQGEDLAKAEREFATRFDADVAAAKTAADKSVMARQLLDKAGNELEFSNTRYVIFKRAWELASDAGNMALAFEVIDRAANRFAIDAFDQKHQTLEAISKQAGSPEAWSKIIDAAMTLLQSAMDEGDFTAASNFAAVLEPALSKVKSSDATTSARELLKTLKAARFENDQYLEARNTLKSDASNAGANFVAGRYLCFNRERWDAGLPLLAKGSDARCKAAAQKDLQAPQLALERAAVGDAWWTVADQNTPRMGAAIRRRAVWWYTKSVEELPAPKRAIVEKRIASLDETAAGNETTGTRAKVPVPVGERTSFQVEGASKVRFSPNGKLLAVSGHGRVCIYDLAAGKQLNIYNLSDMGGDVPAIAFSPDGKRIAAGSDQRAMKIWEVGKPNEPIVCDAPEWGMAQVAFTPDGKHLIGAMRKGEYKNGTDEDPRIYDARTGRLVGKLETGGLDCFALTLTPDGSRAGLIHYPNKLYIWTLGDQRVVKNIEVRAGISADFTPDLNWAVVGDADGNVDLFDVVRGVAGKRVGSHGPGLNVTAVAISADGRRVVSGSGDRTVRVWDVATLKEVAKFEGHAGPIAGLSLSSDGRYVASVSGDGGVKVWGLPK